MLKLCATYSKKVPVEDQEFSSRGYQATVEVELPTGLDAGDLQQRIQQTFALVRDSVETELQNHQPAQPHPQLLAATQPPQPPQQQPQGNPVSEKQLRFMKTLAGRRSMTPAQLDAYVQQLHGIPGITSLTRKQASDLIDTLNTAKAA
jgi:hypothetical protein